MKTSDKQIAEFYEVTPRTIVNYKNGTKGKKRLYDAMKHYIASPPQMKAFEYMSTEQRHKEHEVITNRMQSDIDSLQIIADFIKERESK